MKKNFDKNRSNNSDRSFDRNRSEGSDRKFSKNRSEDSGKQFGKAKSEGSDRKFSRNRSEDSEKQFGRSRSEGSDRKFSRNRSEDSGKQFGRSRSEGSDRKFSRNRSEDSGKQFGRGRSDNFDKSSEDKDFKFEKGPKKNLVYGKHPVAELLNSEKDINKVWISDTFRSDEIFSKLREYNIPFSILDKSKLDLIAEEDVNHQGIIAEVTSKNYTDFDELLEMSKTKEVFFVVLDKLEDPHNLGAVIRTADAAGVDAIIIPKHNAVGLNGTVAKTSAGALERMKVCRVTNLVQAIEDLKKNNVWFVATDMDGKEIYSQANFKGSIGIVLGAEGKGVSKLVKETCDFSVRIPMKSSLESLNVSVSAALMIYEAYKQRGF